MPCAASRGASATTFLRRRLGIVSVDEQREVLRARAREAFEGGAFAVVSFDEGMGHRAERRNAEFLLGQHRRGAREPGDVAGAGGHQSGFGAVRAAQAEIDQQLAGRRQHHARGLGRDQRLEMQDIDQPGLDQLRLRHRRGDAQDRLIGEKHAAFRHGVDVAGEAETGKLVEQCFVEPARAGEPVDLLGEKRRFSRKSSACSRPAAIRNPRRGGNLRTKNSKTAVLVSPWSR